MEEFILEIDIWIKAGMMDSALKELIIKRFEQIILSENLTKTQPNDVLYLTKKQPNEN